MIGPAIEFYDVVVWLHVSSVVVGFGVTFVYPLLFAVATRADPRVMPTIWRIQNAIGSRIIGPSLVPIVATGIYLIADGDWDSGDPWLVGAYAIVLILGGLGGAFFSPTQDRLVELADRDIAAAGDGEVTWSEEYVALQTRLARVGLLSSLLVLVAIFLMTTKPGL